MVVTLRGDTTGGSLDEGLTVSFSVGVLSKAPVVRLELWNGDGLVDAVDLATPTTSAGHQWAWTAERTGSHVFVARAVDAVGRSGESHPVWVTVDPQPEPAEASGARNEGSPRDTGARGAVVIDPGHATSVQSAMAMPVDAPKVTLSPRGCMAVVTAAPEPADGIALYGAAESASSFTLLDVFPPAGGTVAVEIPGGMSVFRTTAYDASGADFSSLVPVEADPSCTAGKWSGDAALVDGMLRSDAPADRAYLYLSAGSGPWGRYPASGFIARDGDGFDFSDVLPPPAPDGAMTFEAWGRGAGGLVFLGAGELGDTTTATVSLVDTATFTGPNRPSLVWVKQLGKPEGQGEFGQPKPEIVATSGRLCTFAEADSAEPEGWCHYLPLNETSSGVFNAGSETDLIFRWGAGVTKATHGIWQVSVFPFPDAPDLDFIGLRAFGDAPGIAGDFGIDIASILRNLESPPEDAPASSVTQPLQWGDLAAALSTSQTAGGSSPPSGAGEMTAVIAGGPEVSMSSQGSAPAAVLPKHPDAIYVRAIALDGSQPLAASAPVKLLIDWSPVPTIKMPPGFTISGTISRPSAPNYDYDRCVRVIENPFGSANPVPDELKAGIGKALYEAKYAEFAPAAVGATICAKYQEPEKPSWLGSLWSAITSVVEAVGKVWNAVADFVNDLKTGIIDFVAEFSGCEAIASAAGMTDAQAKETCVGGLTIVADATLAAYGVPPTVPDFDAVVAAAKGEIRDTVEDLVREEMKQVGVDCDETGAFSQQCADLVDKALNESLDAIEKQVSKATVASAGSGQGWYLYLNEAIKVIPEPAAMLQGPVFNVTITREPSSTTPGPAACSVKASAIGTIHGYSWWDYEQGKQRSGETVTGPVFSPAKKLIDLSDMSGGPTTFTIALKDLVPWYPPGSSDVFWEPPAQKGGKPTAVHTGEEPHTADFFGPNAEITTTVDTCVGTLTLTWPQAGSHTKPQDIVTKPGIVVAP